MPYQAQAVDGIEPISDTVWELAANQALYNVVSGCAATYSAANMTKTIASGTVTHNGTSVTVAGNSVTLISDPSQPRWTWTGINSGGTAVIVSGDPAATPTVPELGDLVAVSLDLVQANQTIANNIATQIEKRIPGPAAPAVALAGSSSAATSTTSISAVDLVTVTTSSIAATQGIRILFNWRKTNAFATAVAFGLKIGATVIVECAAGPVGVAWSGADANAQDGFCEIIIMPRRTNYTTGLTSYFIATRTASFVQTVAPMFSTTAQSAALPTTALTTFVIRAINLTSSNAVEVFDVKVFTF